MNFGFQLEIEAISADVILPMGLDGVGVVCTADSVEDDVGGADGGSNPPCQVHSWLGVVGLDAGV